MNAFTDLFIRRPVLSSVVSLLILLVGLMAGFKLQIRQFPETSNTTITITTTYPGRRGRRDQGLHHHADRAGGGERRGHRHAGVDLAAERLDHHAQSAARRQSRPGDGRHAVEGQPGARPAAARGQRSRRRQADGAGLRPDVPVVQLEGDDALRRSPTISPASSSRGCRRSTASPTRRSSAARCSPCASGSIRPGWRRSASRRTTCAPALAANNFTTAAGEVKSDFTQISVNALTSLDSPKTFGQLVIAAHGDALVRLGDVSQKIELGPQTSDTSSVFDGLKAVFIGIYGTPEANPLTVIDGVKALMPSIQAQLPPGLNATIAYDSTQVHPRLDPRGRQDAGRGGGDRHRRHLPVPRQSALDLHPDRHHSAVADRGDDRAAGARLFDQPADAAGARARHRPRGRRRDRGGREHPPPYRGRHDAVRRGDPRRARDRAAGRSR